MNEGDDLPQINGFMSEEDIKLIESKKLIEGKQYDCQICGKNHTAPFVYRCFCGLRVCENCTKDHENGY